MDITYVCWSSPIIYILQNYFLYLKISQQIIMGVDNMVKNGNGLKTKTGMLESPNMIRVCC